MAVHHVRRPASYVLRVGLAVVGAPRGDGFLVKPRFFRILLGGNLHRSGANLHLRSRGGAGRIGAGNPPAGPNWGGSSGRAGRAAWGRGVTAVRGRCGAGSRRGRAEAPSGAAPIVRADWSVRGPGGKQGPPGVAGGPAAG